MENELKKYLDEFYDFLIEQKFSAQRIDLFVKNEVNKYSHPEAIFRTGSSLILTDWSGKTNNNWVYTFPSDSSIEMDKEKYLFYLKKFLSKQLLLMYSQSYEALERLLKNFLFEVASSDNSLQEIIICKLRKNQKYTRETFPSGETLFKLLDGYIDEFNFKKGIITFDLKVALDILAQTRHKITHNNSRLKKSEIFSTTERTNLFNDLFDFEHTQNSDELFLKLDLNNFINLVNFFTNFSFQIFKKLCIKNQIDWNIYQHMNKK